MFKHQHYYPRGKKATIFCDTEQLCKSVEQAHEFREKGAQGDAVEQAIPAH